MDRSISHNGRLYSGSYIFSGRWNETAGKGCKGNGGRRAVPFAGECRERVTLCPGVTGAGSPCPRVREGSSRRWGSKGRGHSPCGGCRGRSHMP